MYKYVRHTLMSCPADGLDTEELGDLCTYTV